MSIYCCQVITPEYFATVQALCEVDELPAPDSASMHVKSCAFTKPEKYSFMKI